MGKISLSISIQMYQELWYYANKNNITTEQAARKCFALFKLLNEQQKKGNTFAVVDYEGNLVGKIQDI